MKKILLLAIAIAACTASAAQAGTYTYKCRGGTAVANENSHALTWRGTTFKNLKVVEGDCHVNWEATRDGGTAHFCVATQYAADLTIGKDRFECEQILPPRVITFPPPVKGQCSGMLSWDGDGGLALTNPPAEGMCSIVGKADVSRVLQACVLGRRCVVTGITDECVDTGECVEIRHVTKARR
jgi:hypothetical protein